MKAALLPDRGVVKIAGEDARGFLDRLVTCDLDKVDPRRARYGALLTPQGKIIADFIVAEVDPAEGHGFFLDCPKVLAPALVEKLNFYKLRAKVVVEDLSEVLGVMAFWNGDGLSEYGLAYADPRLAALGTRVMLPPHLANEAAADLGATMVDADNYEAHRVALAIPRGGSDFSYGGTFPHEADMDQLHGVDFDKGCYVGQEVVSRVEHRASARTRVVPIDYGEVAPAAGADVLAGEKQIGMLGSTAKGRGLAMLRLDRLEDAVSQSIPITAGGITITPLQPAWADFKVAGAKPA